MYILDIPRPPEQTKMISILKFVCLFDQHPRISGGRKVERNLVIKSGVVNRLNKEMQMYNREAKVGEAKLQQMKDEGKDEYEIKQMVRKQPIRTRYLGHVNGYQPIRDQY